MKTTKRFLAALMGAIVIASLGSIVLYKKKEREKQRLAREWAEKLLPVDVFYVNREGRRGYMTMYLIRDRNPQADLIISRLFSSTLTNSISTNTIAK